MKNYVSEIKKLRLSWRKRIPYRAKMMIRVSCILFLAHLLTGLNSFFFCKKMQKFQIFLIVNNQFQWKFHVFPHFFSSSFLLTLFLFLLHFPLPLPFPLFSGFLIFLKYIIFDYKYENAVHLQFQWKFDVFSPSPTSPFPPFSPFPLCFSLFP